MKRNCISRPSPLLDYADKIMSEQYYYQPEDAADSSNPMGLRNLAYTLLEKAWLIALCLVVAGSLVAFYLYRTTPVYAARAVLKVEPGQPNIIKIDSVVKEEQGLEMLKNIEQMLQSRSLFERVIASNNLAADPRFVSQSALHPPSQRAMVAKLSSMVRANLQQGTSLIEVRVEDDNPELAALVANSLVNELIQKNREWYATISQMATSFLQEEADMLQQKISESESKRQAMKDDSLPLDARQAVILAKLQNFNQKLDDVNSDLISLRAEYDHIQEMGTNQEALLSMPLIANDPNVVPIRASLAQQEVEVTNVKQRYKEKHPKYIEAYSKLAELQQKLQVALVAAVDGVRQAIENKEATKAALDDALHEQEAESARLAKELVPYNNLVHDIEADRKLYDSIIERMKETKITSKIDNDRIQLYQKAEVPSKPVRPKKPQIIVGGLMGGLAVGVALALCLGLLDSSLKTLDEAEQYLNIQVLSTVPKVRRGDNGQRQVVMYDQTQFSGAESFRSLRTSLSMMDPEGERRSYLFTSALPEEGKTFCSVNFAVSLAQQGLRTLLIDCDLRRPMVEEMILGKRRQTLGVTDYLTGQQPFDEIVQPTEYENFYFISAGTTVSNPSELLAQHCFNDLLQEAMRRFDRVVVDSAPIYGVSDTLILVNRLQNVCVVVRAQQTPKHAVLRVVNILNKASAPLAGIILNGMPRSRRGAYHDPYYDYGYYPAYAGKKA